MTLTASSTKCWQCSLRSSTRRQISTPPILPVRALRASRISARNASTATAKIPATSTTTNKIPEYRPVKIQSKTREGRTPTTTERIAQTIREKAPNFTETYIAYGVCEELVKECIRVADYTIPQALDPKLEIPKNEKGEDIGISDSWWYKNLGMPPTFNTWAQISFLHMWLLTVRIRCFHPEHAPTWHQHLLDHFFQIAEDRMILSHRLNSRMLRNKYLKDHFEQWRGCMVAYDTGIMKGDVVLAAAVWRNIFKADPDANLETLAEIVSYMRSVLAAFEEMPDEVIAQGDIVFGDPSSESAIVQGISPMLRKAVADEKSK